VTDWEHVQILVKKWLTALQNQYLDVGKQKVKYGTDSAWQECYSDTKKESRRQGVGIESWSSNTL